MASSSKSWWKSNLLTSNRGKCNSIRMHFWSSSFPTMCVCVCANKCIILHFARRSTHTVCECVFVNGDNYETKNKNSYIKFSMCQRFTNTTMHGMSYAFASSACVYVSVEETRGNHNKSNSNTVGWIGCCCCCLNIVNIRPGVCMHIIIRCEHTHTHKHSQTVHTTAIVNSNNNNNSIGNNENSK